MTHGEIPQSIPKVVAGKDGPGAEVDAKNGPVGATAVFVSVQITVLMCTLLVEGTKVGDGLNSVASDGHETLESAPESLLVPVMDMEMLQDERLQDKVPVVGWPT